MGEEPCNTRLALGFGGGVDSFASSNRGRGRQRKPPVQFHILFPPCPKEEEEDEEPGWLAGEEQGINSSRLRNSEEGEDVGGEAMVGSGWNGCNRGGDDGGGRVRKKLRLTKEQSALLESTFQEHHTLTPTQKQQLAEGLNLRPRQVEVWFQNRRARTKLKQTELDCEFLKRCCESLSDENRRLKKELQELRSTKPSYMQLPKAATQLTMCPSCERFAAGDGEGAAGGIGAPKPGFHSCTVKDDSMAC